MASIAKLLLAAYLTSICAEAVVAQSPEGSPAGPQPGSAGLRSGNIAGTGQTVPNPQKLPSAPRSAVDRPIKGSDAGRTDYGICKGC